MNVVPTDSVVCFAIRSANTNHSPAPTAPNSSRGTMAFQRNTRTVTAPAGTGGTGCTAWTRSRRGTARSASGAQRRRAEQQATADRVEQGVEQEPGRDAERPAQHRAGNRDVEDDDQADHDHVVEAQERRETEDRPEHEACRHLPWCALRVQGLDERLDQLQQEHATAPPQGAGRLDAGRASRPVVETRTSKVWA